MDLFYYTHVIPAPSGYEDNMSGAKLRSGRKSRPSGEKKKNPVSL